MAKRLRCSEVFDGCYFEATGESEAEVLRQATAHAVAAHGVAQMTVELTQKFRSAIRDS